jgi:uncharacterized membrane protein
VSERGVRLAVAAFALVGAGIAAYLTFEHYTGGAVACSTGGCEQVQNSSYSKLVGVPVSLIGLVGYLLIFASAFVRGEVGAVVGGALTLIGFAFAMYLLYVQLAIIEAICQWCVGSDAVLTVLLVLAVLRLIAMRREFAVSAESPG